MGLCHRFQLAALVGVALVVLSACASGRGITISDPMARPSPLEGGTGGAFMAIRNNGGQADRLRSASSPVARAIELHETIDDNGVMRMVPQPDGWEIGPGGELLLKPGGKHLMLFDLARPLQAGETIEITLNFDKAGAVKVQVPVKAGE
jgi:periplasmic copper chaperone A